MNKPTERDPTKKHDSAASPADNPPGDADAPRDEGILESLGDAITSPVRDTEPEPGAPTGRPPGQPAGGHDPKR